MATLWPVNPLQLWVHDVVCVRVFRHLVDCAPPINIFHDNAAFDLTISQRYSFGYGLCFPKHVSNFRCLNLKRN